MNDLKSALAAVSGDAAFAEDFFARYIRAARSWTTRRCSNRAGFILRPRAAGRAWAGTAADAGHADRRSRRVRHVLVRRPRLSGRARPRRHHRVGRRIADRDVRRRRARDHDAQAGRFLQVVYDRRGERITSVLKLVEDPGLELVPAEEAGQTLTDAQRKFRDAWLASAGRQPADILEGSKRCSAGSYVRSITVGSVLA